MAEQRFDILFKGDLQPGENAAAVKPRLAKLFKTDAARVEKLFSGRPVALKRDADEATARKYKTALERAGVKVIVRRSGPGRDAPQTPQAEPRGGSFELRPMEGELLDDSEKQRPRAVDIPEPDYQIAEPGADILEGYRQQETVPPLPDSEFNLAEASGDLLRPEEKQQEQPVEVSTGHLQVLPQDDNG